MVGALNEVGASVEEVLAAQSALAAQLEALATLLGQSEREAPPSLAPKLQALRSAQSRVLSVNEKLAVIQGLM